MLYVRLKGYMQLFERFIKKKLTLESIFIKFNIETL